MSFTSLKSALLPLFVLLALAAPAQNSTKKTKNSKTVDTVGLAAANRWADKEMKHLSLNEKVGQLMFVRVPLTMTKKQ